MGKFLPVALAILIASSLWANPADLVRPDNGITLKGITNPIVSTSESQPKTDIVFDQGATGYYSGYACQWDSVYPFEFEFADNFSVTSTVIIDSIAWWGVLWNGTPEGILGFRIKIFEDSTGYNRPKVNPVYMDRINTFNEIDLGGYYKYEANIPGFQANAGQTYWIVFQPVLIIPPQWGVNGSYPGNTPGWGDGQEAYFRAPLFGYNDWTVATTVWGLPIEASFQIFGSPASQLVVWDFETGPRGWIHTNGQAFPAGWAVKPSNHRSGWECPEPGDSSFWIDSDMAGYVSITDTAYSPGVAVANFQTLKFGRSFNAYSGSERFSVGIRVFSGGTWSAPIELMGWNTDVNPAWDSVDISSYSGADSIKVFFAYTNAYYDWYAAFDNVQLIPALPKDVAVTSINNPSISIVRPGEPINLSASLTNYGAADETVDFSFSVDSAGTIVFSENALVQILAGEVLEYTCTNPWTPAMNSNIVYTITAEVTLDGDQNPANNTVIKVVSTSAWGEWVRIADMPDAVMCHATGYDPINDKLYTFGCYKGGNTFWNYNFEYDPQTDTWATKTPLPYSIDWIDASYASGIFYIFGGFENSVVKNYNLQYDPYTDTWSSGPNMPARRIAGQQVVYRDSLIYYLGGHDGSGPTSTVQIYNIYTNSWTTGTSLPLSFMMGGAAITEDTIWIVGGYTGSGYYSNIIYGLINSSDASQISWNTGPALPVQNFNNGLTVMNINGHNLLYMVGGFQNGYAGSGAWEFDPNSNTWFALPNYPTNIVRNDFLVARQGNNEIYVLGGDNSGGWTETPESWKLQWITPSVNEDGQIAKRTFGFAPNMPTIIVNHANISYNLTKDGRVTIVLYNSAGRAVNTIIQNQTQSAGTHNLQINMVDEKGKALPGGIYFLRLTSEERSVTKKLFLVK